MPLDPFDGQLIQELASQIHNLFNKFSSQALYLELFKTLESVLLKERPNHGRTVPVLKEFTKAITDLVFGVVRVVCAETQGLFKILLRTDFVTVLILELQAKITKHPKEIREDLLNRIFLIALTNLFLDKLGEVGDHRQVLDGILINLTHPIVHEVARHQQCQRKDPHIVVIVFI